MTSPRTREELLHTIAALQHAPFRFGAGYTDLLLLLERQPIENLTVVNLARLEDDRFTGIADEGGGLRVGALVTAEAILRDARIRIRFPVLAEAAGVHASRQIREVATVGGNICTASPAGDLACALVALQAECEILNAAGRVRTTPLERFFRGPRATDLARDEVLCSVRVPSPAKGDVALSRFLKVGTRRSMECSVVSLATHLLTERGVIVHAAFAIGSAAPVIRSTPAATESLVGRKLEAIGPAEAAAVAERVAAYAQPISDIRASAWYRTEVLRNVCRGLFTTDGGATPSPTNP